MCALSTFSILPFSFSTVARKKPWFTRHIFLWGVRGTNSFFGALLKYLLPANHHGTLTPEPTSIWPLDILESTNKKAFALSLTSFRFFSNITFPIAFSLDFISITLLDFRAKPNACLLFAKVPHNLQHST